MNDELLDSDRVTDGPLLALHDELVAAAMRHGGPVRAPISLAQHRSVRPRAPRLAVAAAAVFVVVAGILGYGLATDDSHAGADVTVERHGDSVTVSLDRSVSVQAIEKALDDTGVDVKVIRQTTGPSRVGQFVGIIGPPSAKLVGGDGTAAPTATFVKGSKVQLMLGVRAVKGAPYDSATVATAKGEPLYGIPTSGVTLGSIQQRLDDVIAKTGITIRYQVAAAGQTEAPSPDLMVVGASGISATIIVIVLTPA